MKSASRKFSSPIDANLIDAGQVATRRVGTAENFRAIGYRAALGCLLCWLSWSLTAHAGETTDQARKVDLTYRMLQSITWPNESRLTQFTLGVIGVDNNLYQTMAAAAPQQQVRDRPVRVIRLQNPLEASPGRFQLIYVGTRQISRLPTLARRLRGSGTLLLTEENTASRASMINLYRTADNSIDFQINRANLLAEKLQLDHLPERQLVTKKLGMPQPVILEAPERDITTRLRESEDNRHRLKTALSAKEDPFQPLRNKILRQQNELNANQERLQQQKILVDSQ